MTVPSPESRSGAGGDPAPDAAAPAPAPIEWHAGDRIVRFPRRPLVVGIVNVNDDSFSGDGTLDVDEALATAAGMVRAGADVIDVGAESARTNRAAIPVPSEIGRLVPFIERFLADRDGFPRADAGQLAPPLLSINTWRPEVVEAVLPVGGELLNDMGALPDGRNAALCARHGAGLLVMHSVGAPKVAHTSQRWDDVLASMEDFFEAKLALAREAGLDERRVILDPGIDFAKQREDNLRILAGLARLHRFGRPILLPVSRKTVIGEVLDLPEPADRDAGTIACLTAGLLRGAQLFRVHNVAAAARAVKVLWTLVRPAAGGAAASPAPE